MIINKNKTGFTLLELIIVIAILGIALSVATTFFSFGNKIFSKSESRAEVQSNVRLASMRISDEIRTAKTVKLLENAPPLPILPSDKFNYIYVSENEDKIMHRDSSNPDFWE